ncbi:LOW QUALITY PROTEIN: uncharacterized protein LJ264_006376 [Porphyrio hochstetteri]
MGKGATDRGTGAKSSMGKKVAIIGGGSSGLCAIKACLQEGLEPVCFERSGDIGGLWRFEERPEEGRASIYRSVIINTSKEMMCFSDFPIPEDFPNYMHNSKIMEYFRMYARRFDLLRHIRFRTTVCRVSKRPDFATTGQWDVVTESEGKQEEAVFDAVLVCTGHHTEAHLPLSTFPGIEKFKGRYLHSRDYKDSQDFRDKMVVVVGIGNSGSDLAVEISQAAKQVFLSTRRGAWILNRVGDQGYPIDIIFTTRMKTFLKNLMSPSMVSSFVEKQLNMRFNHSHYGLKPKHRIIDQHPTINDDLPNRIISGRVRVKPNIQEFTETAAIFEDGTREDIDAVVFATGYSFSFPFLEGCVKVVENQVSLYKFMFPPDMEKPTLAFIGLVQPLGAIMPISELQCRWATRVFKGLNKLPPRQDMEADIKQKKEAMAKRYVKSQRHTIQVDYIPCMDELACQMGVKPNLLTLFLTDPKLALEVAFGPCTPYQYRLRGPGEWAGAREAILTQQQRIMKPLQTRHVEEHPSAPTTSLVFKLVGAVAVLAIIFAYFYAAASHQCPEHPSGLSFHAMTCRNLEHDHISAPAPRKSWGSVGIIKRLRGLPQHPCHRHTADMAAQRVAIIGAGASGLCALKCCLDEGLVPTCFERSGDIGGLWLFEERPEEGHASIYRSVTINASKEMMCFSDFPIPEDFPNYMHNSKIMEYFRMYARRFDLLRHIRFRTTVCRVSKRPDFATTGQWDVVTESEGKQEEAVFDAVLVCTGHHTEAHLPLSTFPGLEKFEGCYLHSWDYKSPQSFSGKRVVVICTGNSGINIAVELSHAAKQVFLSTKCGTWVMHRLAEGGFPFDFFYISRFIQLLHSLLPHSVSSFLMERKLNARFDHALYGLQPQHGIFNQYPTVNDDLPNRIISGRVRVKPNIQEFTETAAIFEDGTREDIDAVVFATGYSFSFPFLEGCVKVVENQVSLYKFMFPPDMEKPTLAFIGLVQPLGAIMPISKLQCRWATRVFKGLQDLPPSPAMLADVTQVKEKMAKRYVKSQRHTIQVDYIPYMDELACQVGVKPNLFTLFLTDPKLVLEVAFGPCTPYQYRLRGPGEWAGTREAILTQQQRVVQALRARAGDCPPRSSTVPHIFKVFFSVGLIVATLVYISFSP